MVVYTRNDTEQVILNSNQSENKQKDKYEDRFPIPGDQNPDHRQGSLSTRPLSRSRLPYTGLTTTLTTSSTVDNNIDHIFDTFLNDPHGPYSLLCRCLLWATVFNRNPTEVSKLWLRTLRATSPSQRSRWSSLRATTIEWIFYNAYDIASFLPNHCRLTGYHWQDNRVSLRWKTPISSLYTEYHVKYRTFGEAGPSPWSAPIAVARTATTFTLTDLPPGEQFEIQVQRTLSHLCGLTSFFVTRWTLCPTMCQAGSPSEWRK